ncbi:phage portal protein [Niallia sp. 01092]|uniref:phage portal protein n=1 Tax=Niallia sp. 01092 TaxID=3457759 RepID=UPI003FD6533D
MEQEKIILLLLDEMDKRKSYYEKLERYYNGDHDILYENAFFDQTKNDRRAVFNYCRKTVQNYVGYMLGKPISYQSKNGNKQFINSIEAHFGYWEKEHNIKLKELSEVYGVSYEVAYSTKNKEFQCAAFSPLEMITLTDGTIEKNVSLAVRRYKKKFDDTTYVDVWDSTFITKYSLKNQLLTVIDKKPHLFSSCPVNENPNNDLKKSAFADVISIVDLYNAANSTAVNEMLDHRSAYLVIEGADLDYEEAVKMKQNGILITPPGSKVYWATKDINNSFFNEMLDKWQDEVYIQTNTVNLNENFQSNTSGVSIRLKLQELENLTALKEATFEKVIKKRLELFCDWLQTAEGKECSYRDVVISFSRNVPVDEKTIADMIVELKDMLPLEDLLSWHPRVSNPQAAIERLMKERDAMGLNELDNALQNRNVNRDE